MDEAQKLRSTVAELSCTGQLIYPDYLEFARSAGDNQDWAFALDLVETALPMITAENVIKEYRPGLKVSKDRLTADLKRVQQTALLMKGWCLVNLKSVEKGKSIFKKVEKYTTYNYLGIPENSLNHFMGRTLILEENYKGAIRYLAPAALIAGREHDLELLKLAYIKRYGNSDNFGNFCRKMRFRIAPPMDDFSLPDYQGNIFTLSKLGAKILLIYCWFPMCSACRVELPRLESIYQKYKNKGFSIVAIDSQRDTQRAKAFIDEHKLSFHLLETGAGDKDIVKNMFRIKVFPTSYLVDKRRRIIASYDWQREIDINRLAVEITSLL